jgi:hypothetical protein
MYMYSAYQPSDCETWPSGRATKLFVATLAGLTNPTTPTAKNGYNISLGKSLYRVT